MRRFLPKHSLFSLLRIQVNAGGWLSVFIILSITFLVGLNLWRVGVNAQESLDVFEFEQQSLQELQEENRKLEDQLDYYQSYEYKKLYVRDNLRLAESGEKLYNVVEPVDYYRVEDSVPEFFVEGEYSSWWGSILF